MDRLRGGEFDSVVSLELLIEQNSERLEQLAVPMTPLTAQRLIDLGHPRADIAREAEATELLWPDKHSAVTYPTSAYFDTQDPAHADYLFARRLIETPKDTRGGIYNNLPALLRAKPIKPEPGQEFMDFFSKNMQDAAYGVKPYLHRAYALEPDFMNGLRTVLQPKGDFGYSEWMNAMIQGGEYPERHSEAAVLLRGSRIAYSVLMNLMRVDDLAIQGAWIGMSQEKITSIKDPEVELRT